MILHQPDPAEILLPPRIWRRLACSLLPFRYQIGARLHRGMDCQEGNVGEEGPLPIGRNKPDGLLGDHIGRLRILDIVELGHRLRVVKLDLPTSLEPRKALGVRSRLVIPKVPLARHEGRIPFRPQALGDGHLFQCEICPVWGRQHPRVARPRLRRSDVVGDAHPDWILARHHRSSCRRTDRTG